MRDQPNLNALFNMTILSKNIAYRHIARGVSWTEPIQRLNRHQTFLRNYVHDANL